MTEIAETEWQGKRYWLVGASEGLGRALAHQMSRAGVELILSARTRERLDDLAAELPGRSSVVPVDVSDSASVAAAFRDVGEIDGVVWLAGVYWPIKADAWDAGRVEAMFDVNLTGAARVLGVVLPDFVRRGKGHVVLTGSLSGFRGLPGAVGYSASKAGILSLAETLRMDLHDTGIKVQIANPGYIRTRLTEKNDFRMPAIMEPEVAAQEIWEHMGTDSFSKSFPFGFSLIFRLSNFLPDWAYFRIFR
jgi:short-subunit dehydrogenase